MRLVRGIVYILLCRRVGLSLIAVGRVAAHRRGKYRTITYQSSRLNIDDCRNVRTDNNIGLGGRNKTKRLHPSVVPARCCWQRRYSPAFACYWVKSDQTRIYLPVSSPWRFRGGYVNLVDGCDGSSGICWYRNFYQS